MKRPPNRQRGFTIVELGIVVAVIAVLASVVFVSRGFVDSARVGSAVQLAVSIRGAAHAYAERKNGGASFAGISLNGLESEGLLPAGTTSPWNTTVVVSPVTGNSQIRIEICTPKEVLADDLAKSLSGLGTPTRDSRCCARCNVLVTAD